MRRAGSAFSGAVLLALWACAVANVPRDGNLTDPTRPVRGAVVTERAAPVGRPALSSVLVGPERRVAVIDGRRMTVGQVHDGMKVLEIHPDRVVVSVNGSGPLVLVLTNARMHKELR